MRMAFCMGCLLACAPLTNWFLIACHVMRNHRGQVKLRAAKLDLSEGDPHRLLIYNGVEVSDDYI